MLDSDRLLRALTTWCITGAVYVLLFNLVGWFAAMLSGVLIAACAGLLKETVDRFIDGNEWDKDNFIAEGIGIFACMVIILISIYLLNG